MMKSTKTITVLGSTGSIGRQTLDVCREFGYKPAALSANKNIELLAEQIIEFRPETVSVGSESSAEALMKILKLNGSISDFEFPKILYGEKGCEELASYEKSDIVLAAIVGIAGLRPVISAIKAGKDIALANKECLVAGGGLVKKLAAENKVSVIPVDSEHSAIRQCLESRKGEKPRRIFLTCSGGPFLRLSSSELSSAGPEEALKHPTWNMGGKISVDSATLMNKGLELIEATELFDVSEEAVEILIHPQSIIHSMVEWKDGAVIAQLSSPDMRLPIQYALSYPDTLSCPSRRFNPFSENASTLTFEAPDQNRFPCLRLARMAARLPKSAAIYLNAANEIAVEAFLSGKINYWKLIKLLTLSFASHLSEGPVDAMCLEKILKIDEKARSEAKKILSTLE